MKNELIKEQFDSLLNILKFRFGNNMIRHTGLTWTEVENNIIANTDKMEILKNMEETGGEPDVVGFEPSTNEYIFYDCVAESPIGRRSLCYDTEALDARKENKPKNNVIDMASEIGIKLLSESEYSLLQTLGKFDTKTSSWVKTPEKIRKLGGALFCDRRYDTVFLYHNGADSYYAARGFRGSLRV